MTEQPQLALPPEERPFWKLDRSEQRVLLITFVGGVASIVTAACIVGVAIAFARDYQHPNNPPAAKLGNVVHHALIPAVVLGVYTLGVLAAAEYAKTRHLPVAPALRGVAWVLAVVTGLAYVLLALTGIGVAAGVH